MVYDSKMPVDTVFNAIDDFSNLSDLQDIPLTDRRRRQIAYVIFQRSRAFTDGLKKWNGRTAATQTYNEFKIFMRKEHSDLEAVGALSIRDTVNHAELRELLDEMQDALSNHL